MLATSGMLCVLRQRTVRHLMMALSCSMPSLFKNKSKGDKYKNALPVDLALLGAVPPDVQELAQSRQQLLWQLVQRWADLIEEIFNEDVWGTKH